MSGCAVEKLSLYAIRTGDGVTKSVEHERESLPSACRNDTARQTDGSTNRD